MKVKVKMNHQAIKKINMAIAESLKETGDAIYSDLRASQTIPFDTGALQNRSTFVDDSKKTQGKIKIVSDTPYARRLYFHPEFNFQKEKNPNAGAFWFSPYISGAKKNFANKIFARIMKEKMK